MTPAPWVNVIANPDFGTLVSESGSATTWSENAHEFRLTPWSNDAVCDPNTEAFYIRDEVSGAFWSPTLLPTRRAGTFTTRHGFGYSVFEHAEDQIDSGLCMYVAVDSPVKFSVLTLHNRSNRARTLSVTGYVDWVLGDERAKTRTQIVTEIDRSTGALFARNGYNTDFAGRTAFFDVDVDGYPAMPEVCGDRADFFGSGGTLAAPAALSTRTLYDCRAGSAPDWTRARSCVWASTWFRDRRRWWCSGLAPARRPVRRATWYSAGDGPVLDARRSMPSMRSGAIPLAQYRYRHPTVRSTYLPTAGWSIR